MDRSRNSEVVVVFDLGEVLATPRELLAELARQAGSEEQRFSAAYWAHRDLFDRGAGLISTGARSSRTPVSSTTRTWH